jgi:xanthine dehydrogenase accessory factor
VKHWQEMGPIADRILHLGLEGRRAALAIVTRIEGSSYRRPGAKLLIEDEGDTVGGVSGGCLEEDVRQVGLSVLRSGKARVLHYDTVDDDSRLWGLGLGCDGAVDILVQPISPADAAGPWARLRDELHGDSPLAVSVLVEDQGPGGVLVIGPSGPLAGTLGDPGVDAQVEAMASAALHRQQSMLAELGTRRVFTEVLLPPPTLLVCGAGDDARPLVNFAAAVGFRVVVADHRPAHLTAKRFPSALRLLRLRPDQGSSELPADRATYAVVKTHSLEHDAAWVQRLIGTDAPYVGILGPRARIKKVLTESGIRGNERVFGPVGLDLGADGPEQVALSVVAEVLAVWSGRSPRHLREREGALHARP